MSSNIKLDDKIGDPETNASLLPTLNRVQRKHCYQARDLYFKCVHESTTSTGVREKLKAFEECASCSIYFESFKESCPPLWVTYFIKVRKDNLLFEERKRVVQEKISAEKLNK